MFLDLSYLSSTFLSLLTCPHSFNCPLLMTVYKEGADEDVCDTHSCFQNTLFFSPKNALIGSSRSSQRMVKAKSMIKKINTKKFFLFFKDLSTFSQEQIGQFCFSPRSYKIWVRSSITSLMKALLLQSPPWTHSPGYLHALKEKNYSSLLFVSIKHWTILDTQLEYNKYLSKGGH